MTDDRLYEGEVSGKRRSAPAALRNRGPIADVLADWLPKTGLVLEIASGTGEHAAFFAERFPGLDWQPSDTHPEAIESIRAWRSATGLANLREPVVLDAAAATAADWPVAAADALLNINMVHISPWASALGLLDGAGRVLGPGSPLILYGPWLSDSIDTAPSNLAFDSDLKLRNPQWGLRRVEDFSAQARSRHLHFVEQRPMPANNLMLLFRKGTV